MQSNKHQPITNIASKKLNREFTVSPGTIAYLSDGETQILPMKQKSFMSFWQWGIPYHKHASWRMMHKENKLPDEERELEDSIWLQPNPSLLIISNILGVFLEK